MADKSTIVRFFRWVAPVVVTLAPGLAARWLERLFLKPRRWPTPRREVGWMTGARRDWTDFDDNRRMPLFSFGGDGPVVLLVHGWSGRGSQMGAFIRPLLAKGYRVVTFDAPGHGQADGALSGLPEMATAIERVAAAVGPIHTIIAHSLGTAAATIAVSRGLSVQRLVYVAPPDNPGRFLNQAAALLGFGDSVATRTRRRIERRFGLLFEDARGTALAPAIAAPLLVLHDDGDLEVPHGDGERLAAAWPRARVVITTGLGHRRILRAPEVIDAAVRFIGSAHPESDHPDTGEIDADIVQPGARVARLARVAAR